MTMKHRNIALHPLLLADWAKMLLSFKATFKMFFSQTLLRFLAMARRQLQDLFDCEIMETECRRTWRTHVPISWEIFGSAAQCAPRLMKQLLQIIIISKPFIVSRKIKDVNHTLLIHGNNQLKICEECFTTVVSRRISGQLPPIMDYDDRNMQILTVLPNKKNNLCQAASLVFFCIDPAGHFGAVREAQIFIFIVVKCCVV